MKIIIDKKLPKTYQQEIKVISWNLNIENTDGKNNNAIINEITEKNADVIMLQECIKNITNELIHYISYSTVKSHCGTVNLLIHKRLNPELINVFKDNGILIYHLNTIYGQIIVASIHLPPFNKINDKILRTITIYKITNFLKTENLTKLPIIVGGDTNMQDDECIGNLSEDILEDLYDNYGDENNYHTWPIRNNKLNNKLNKKYRFDRFFYSNLTVRNFNSWSSEYSNHIMIETDITFGNKLFDSINTKLHKITMDEKISKNKIIIKNL
jgi:exonuclease III